MKDSKPRVLAALIVGLASIVLAAVIGGLAAGSPPTAVGEIPSPDIALAEFMDALCGGDYQTADSYLANYESLNLGGGAENEASQKLFDYLRSSYAYKLPGECSVKGDRACGQVEFTYFNLDEASKGLNELAVKHLGIFITKAQSNDDIYDENGGYRKSAADTALNGAVDEILEAADRFCVTESISLELIYTGGQWKIMINDELVRCLLGGIE